MILPSMAVERSKSVVVRAVAYCLMPVAYCLMPVACCLLPVASADEPCRSGPQVGQRTGPYAFLVATGAQRGKSHCYICETGERPAVIVFARTPTDSLGRLLADLDQSISKNQVAELRAWTTFLSDDQPNLDPRLVEWARKHGIRNVPIGVFEDRDGPPSYRLHTDADVTVIVAVKQKVVANYAYRAGELNDERVKEVLAAVPRVLASK